MNTVSVRNLLLFIILIFTATALSAADNHGPVGVIEGRIYDAATREPLIGASVVLLGTELGAATDEDGRFRLTRVPAGAYRAQANMIGYSTLLQPDVVIGSGQQLQLDFALELSAVEVGEVVIEPRYFSRTTGAAVSSQSLSNEEIRRAPGGLEDVVRAVAVLPGVVQASAGRNDLIVRGGAPSENLYTVDGNEIPNINHFGTQGATGGPLSFINLDYVRDVSFATGGFGAKYGDRLSSVMNLELENGRSDRIGGKATISASQFGLNLEGPAGKDGTFLFSARRSYLDFIFRAAGFSFVPEYWDFLSKTTRQLNSTNEISFWFIGALDNVRFFNEDADARFDNSRILGNSQDQYASGLEWRHLFRRGFATVSFGRSYATYDFIQSDSLLNPVFRSRSAEGESSLRSDVVLAVDNHTELSFGAQGKSILLDGDLLLPDTLYTSFNDTLAAGSRDWVQRASKASAYAQLSRSLTKELRAEIGGRTDYFDLIENKWSFAPRAALRYSLTDKTSLSASGGLYYQSPSYIWLVANEDNRSLDPVRADQLVLGIEHLIRPDTKLRLEVYTKQYRDYPVSLSREYLLLSNTGAGYGGAEEGFASFGLDPLASRGEGNSRGIELLAQKRLSEIPCYGIVSLTWSQTEFKAIDGVTRPGLYDQRVIFNLSGGYRLSDVWEFSSKFRYGSGTPFTPFAADGSQSVDLYNSGRLPDFHSLDLRVDRRWNFREWGLITYLDIQNVYNYKPVQGYRWNAREQRVERDSGSIGLLPSIGVSAVF